MSPRTLARCGGPRGLSLIEVLVVAAVVGLMLVASDRLLRTIHIASRTAQLAADVQQTVRVSAARLRRELRESQPGAVRCYPDPACSPGSTQLAFPSARPSDAASVFCLDVALTDRLRSALESACGMPIPLTGTYAPVWQRYIAYHRNDSGELRRLVQTGPLTLPLASGAGQVLAEAIASFGVSKEGSLVRLRLTSLGQDAVQGGPVPPQQFTVDDVIQLQNLVPTGVG